MATPHPTTLHRSTPITQDLASKFLSTYLTTATTTPAYQPNAILTESGPISRTAGSSAPNLTLHNLKRVLKGLEGEYLGKQLLPGAETSSDGVKSIIDSNPGGATDADDASVFDDKRKRTEWEDRMRYEQAQEELDGELGARDTTEPTGRDLKELVVVGEEGEEGTGKKRALSEKEKADRKAAKKARRKAEKSGN